MNFGYSSNGASLDNFDTGPKACKCVPLCSQLSRKFLFLRKLGQSSYFPNIMRQGFFEVDMLAPLHGPKCGMKMSMIRGAD